MIMSPSRSFLSVSHRSHPPQHQQSLEVTHPSSDRSAAVSLALPMSIPGTRPSVPPPLPPPNHLPDLTPVHDPGWQWSNDSRTTRADSHSSIRPGSSLLGGSQDRFYPSNSYANRSTTGQLERSLPIGMGRNESVREDRRAALSEDSNALSTSNSNYRLHSERQLEQRALEASSQTYDKHLLSRIGGPRTPKHGGPSQSLHAQDSNMDPARRNLSQLIPLTLPERHMKRADSPRSARWASASSGPASPGFISSSSWSTEHGPLAPHHMDSSAHLSNSHVYNNSSSSNNAPVATPYYGTSIGSDDMVSQRGSYESSVFAQDDLTDDDRHPSGRHQSSNDEFYLSQKAGVKRRASSPPRDIHREDRSSVSSVSGQSDMGQRRPIQYFSGQLSPGTRAHLSHSSVSSASSCGFRNGSLGSSLGPTSMVSSMTSITSGRLSPTSLTSTTRPYYDDRHAVTSATAEACISPRQHNLARVHGIHICECCPKKPKKFDTEEELRIHESEKQYTCLYCPNRFKNKNEAERHQNSLHLRRHSWSCAALSTVEAAFHASPSGHEADLCGFCGEEFSNPPQWDVRAEHLNHVHKFGECNQSKKFFRADHFRQHLKHSHAGTSGKWTNMLENSCMKEEPLPEKRTTSLATTGSTTLPRPLTSTMLPSTRSLNGPFQSHIHLESSPR